MQKDDAESCRLCGDKTEYVFSGKLLEHQVKYYHCPNCDYLQTERPTWLAEAYASSVITESDTGILTRQVSALQSVCTTLLTVRKRRGVVLDDAGGYGLLTRAMRDHGIEAYWNDIYCPNLFAKHFVWHEQNQFSKPDLLTLFEVLEHVENPVEFMKEKLEGCDHILCSTLLRPSRVPEFNAWHYYRKEHGQHIGFFTKGSIRFLADKLGVHVVSDGYGTHFFSRRPISNVKWKILKRTGPLTPIVMRKLNGSKTLSDSKGIEKKRLAQ